MTTAKRTYGIRGIRCQLQQADVMRIGRMESLRAEEGQKSPSEYAKELKDFCDRLEKEYDRVVSWVFIDPSAAGLIEEVRRIMPHIDVIPAFNDVKLGISRVQKFFSFRRILINQQNKRC